MARIEFRPSDRTSTFVVSPALKPEQITALPSVAYCGSEGSEWLPPTHYVERDLLVIQFDAWAIGQQNTKQVIGYMERLAQLMGVAEVDLIVE